jgi:2-methylcitrate dehydratase PrpD
MVVGAREPISKILTTYFLQTGGAPEAGIAGAGYRTSVENAAFANATFAHGSELEDNELPSITSDYWMFPALFALAERQVSSGREIIEAAIVAWEVASRFCRAAEGYRLMQVHICPPSWFGVLGVAAAGARLLRLSATETEHALAMAGSNASGLGQAGCDVHFLESGHTCRNGIQAAMLAKAGATGEIGVLELPFGLYAPVRAAGADVDLDSITDACIKKYSACTYTHTSVDGLGLLMKEHKLRNEDVQQVETQVSAVAQMAVGTHPNPVDLQEARFSLEYLLGEVLLRGKVDVHSFVGPEKLSDPRHQEAASKVRVSALPDVHPAAPNAQVTVVKKNGERLVKRMDGWIGSPQHPLTTEQVRDVCRPFLEVMLNTAQCDRVEELMLNLEQQPDILELMDILTFGRVGHRGHV